MGAWGVKIDQNDVYADVRDFYSSLLRYGISDDEALQHTLNEFSGYIGDDEDGILFWLSLADIMWKLGRLTEEIKKSALEYIDSDAELVKWYQVSQAQGDARKKILDDLKDRLCTEQPEKKKFGKKRYKKCTWQNGDIYRYKFMGETVAEYGMLGQYLFIQKVNDLFIPDPEFRVIKSVIGEPDVSKGDVYPIIRFWISENAEFVPNFQNRNECVANIGAKAVHNPKDYRFYILDFPGKSDLFEYVCNSECIIPDGEDSAFIHENHIKPRHLTWRFFEKHVIGRYLYWTKQIDIFHSK